MSYCKKCEDFHFGGEKCLPIFEVANKEYMEFSEILALDHANAAEKWAEKQDEDRELVDCEMILIVKDSKGLKKEFRVRAEVSIEYNATEI